MLARQIHQPVRTIVYRTRGHSHGPITRLMSPGDLGELLKPFVFLDLFAMDAEIALPPMDMGWHPHSGRVSLKDGERWTYHPPAGHTVAFVADGATRFVLGSAAKHRH